MIKSIEEHEFKECYDVMMSAYEEAEKKERPDALPRGRENKYENMYSEYKSGHLFFGYFSGKKIIGMIRIIRKQNSCQIKDIAVLTEFQHNGYGSELMEFAKKKAKEFGVDKVELGFFLDNTQLKQWYEKRGFILSKTVTHIYDDAPHLIGIMEFKI